MATDLAWDGICQAADQPLIRADDRSYLAGEGAFETLRVTAGHVQALPWHLERLHGTLAWLGWPERLDVAQVRRTATELLARNGLTGARLRLTVSRDPQGLHWLLQAVAYQPPAEALGRDGVAVISVADVAHPRLPHKLTSRAAYAVVDRLAKEAGVYEGLFCDGETWLEGSRTNLLALRGDQLFVGDGRLILPGIARRAIIAAAGRSDLRLSHVGVDRWATTGYDGLFLTNSLIGVLPVCAVDGEAVAVSARATRRLREALQWGLAQAMALP